MTSTIDAPEEEARTATRHLRVAVIGAGFSGIGTAILLRREGIENFLVFERGDDVGGTWRDNSYPGCECDVMSLLYSFSFAQNPGWEKTFSGRDELYAYLRELPERFGVTEHIRLGHELLDARWDETRQHWRIETSGGHYTAQVLVTGSGHLSEPAIPAIDGLAEFGGAVFHSAQWDHDVPLAGKRVAVIGTGASAIQFVPAIQPEAGRLDLYQRTPPWVLPKGNKQTSKLQFWLRRNVPGYQSFRRTFNLYGREILAYLLAHPKAMRKYLLGMAQKHLDQGVPDPELRAKLQPDYDLGCKRMLLSDTYYQALSAPNVDVITDGIDHVEPGVIVTSDGQRHPADAIVFGTGFRSKDRPITYRLRGSDGRTLAETWAGGMSAHLGTTVAGFPNLFMLLGPNTTLAHSAETVMIEMQLAYVLDALRRMDRDGLSSVDVRPEAQATYNAWISSQLEDTVWTVGSCNSGYLDAHGRNPLIWPTYLWRFRSRSKRFDLASYRTVRAGSPVGETVAR